MIEIKFDLKVPPGTCHKQADPGPFRQYFVLFDCFMFLSRDSLFCYLNTEFVNYKKMISNSEDVKIYGPQSLRTGNKGTSSCLQYYVLHHLTLSPNQSVLYIYIYMYIIWLSPFVRLFSGDSLLTTPDVAEDVQRTGLLGCPYSTKPRHLVVKWYCIYPV